MSFFPILDPIVDTQFNWDLLSTLLVDTGGRKIKIRFGTSSVTFSASDTSAQVAIPHGMGSVPVLAVGWARNPANARLTIQESQAADATNIYLKSFQSAGIAITATQNIYWLAIG